MSQAKLKPLDSIQKRDLLANANATLDLLRGYAELYLAEGALNDAFAFFDRLADTAGIERLKQMAIDQGNAFLLYRIADADHVEVSPEEWRRAGERAVALGKKTVAAQAFLAGGDRDRAAALAEELPPGALPQLPGEEGDKGSS